MAALGILIAYIFYGFVVLTGLVLCWKIFTPKSYLRKILYAIGSLFCFAFVWVTIIENKRDLKQEEQQFVGTYYLTQYPNCDSCKAILKSDNSFIVISYKTKDKEKVLEKGNWHYVAEGDFLGVYMDKNESELLGSSRFDYSYYINRHNKLIEAPKVGPF